MKKFNLIGKVTPSQKYWWLNEESQTVLERGYLLKGESVEDAVVRVTTASAKRLNRPDLQPLFQTIVERGWMSLASPIWSNMGNTSNKRGLSISCFQSHYSDSMQSIIEKNAEVSAMTSFGGGTSGYFGDIRPRGAKIRNNGESNGAVAFMEIVDKTMNIISQGSFRKGAFASYLPIEHGDIEEFLQIKDIGHPIQNLFFGVTITNKWMEEMIAGDKDKRKIWAKVLESRQQKGMPYLFFTDNVNDTNPDVYKVLDKKVNASNLCVSGDTLLHTIDGDKQIKDLVGTYQFVWNGKNYESSYVCLTGTDQKLYEVVVKQSGRTDSFKTLDCTSYHKWYDYKGEIVRTIELKEGDRLESFILPSGEVISSYIHSINELDGLHDTFCVNEPKEHKAMFNGVLTGNCSEIALASTPDESFVCCLSSMNLELYDEWKDTDAVFLATMFLDGVMEEFIQEVKDEPFMESAYNFAYRNRALGLGVLGYHSYLQKSNVPFESWEARKLNVDMFKLIEQETTKASLYLAQEYGCAPVFNAPEAKDLIKYRNTHRMAVAPTTSSSSILGQVSAGIEPYSSNYFKVGLAKGNFMRRNKYLEKLLESKGKNTEDVWKKIMMDGGSVLGLDFLSKEEKEVFKTFKEINQVEILNQAVSRQRFIDQSQSLNLNIPPEVPVKDVNKMIIDFWRSGGKTLYYQRSQSVAKELVNSIVSCSSCEA